MSANPSFRNRLVGHSGMRFMGLGDSRFTNTKAFFLFSKIHGILGRDLGNLWFKKLRMKAEHL